jgi:hypothetical protein
MDTNKFAYSYFVRNSDNNLRTRTDIYKDANGKYYSNTYLYVITNGYGNWHRCIDANRDAITNADPNRDLDAFANTDQHADL